MHVLSNEALLVITAVVDIAIHGRDTPVKSDQVASRLGLSPHALEPALRALSHGGIVTSPDGAWGSFQLACEPCNISVADILRAGGFLETCNDELDDSILMRAIVLPALRQASKAFAEQLDAVSLAQLVQAAAKQSSPVRL